MRRRLATLVSAASLVLFVAATAMWVRSHHVYDRAQLTIDRRYVAAQSTCGFFTVFYKVLDPDEELRSRRWSFYRHETRDFGRSLFTTEWKRQHAVVRVPGFEFRSFDTFVELAMTWPLLMLTAFAIPASRLVRRMVRHARQRAGRCSACGYDCRDTPDRCPECGAVPQPRREPPHNQPMQRTAAASSGAVESNRRGRRVGH